MEAAVRALAHLPALRHTAVLGVMAELGSAGPDAHRRIADVAGELGVRIVSFGGADYGSSDVVIGQADDVNGAVALLGDLDAEDAVLVKGSRIAGLERLAAALLES